jgi:hypothetical protein
MNSLLLSVIIVSYNTQDLTLQTIDSVQKSIANSSLLNKQTEIIVVDNNSSDDSASASRKKSTSSLPVKVIVNQRNLGFGPANNQAIKQAKGQYLLFLNSDTIVQNDALTKMVEAFQQQLIDEATATLSSRDHRLDRLGILAASLLNPDGSYQPQGGSLPSLFSLTMHMLMIDDLPLVGRYIPSTQRTGRGHQIAVGALTTSGLIQQDWVGATAMMVPSKTIEEIGSFDQNIFMYGEDVELCIRAQNHHWDVAIHPEAQVVHLGSASSSSKRAIHGEFKGYQYIWAKHKPHWQVDPAKQILRLGAALRVLLFGTILRDSAKADIYRELL